MKLRWAKPEVSFRKLLLALETSPEFTKRCEFFSPAKASTYLQSSAATNILIKYVELDPEEITLRELAVIALGRIGPKAKDSLPALEELVNTELDWLLRIRAVEAIDKIKGKKALGQSRGDAALIK